MKTTWTKSKDGVHKPPQETHTITIYYKYVKIDLEFLTIFDKKIERSIWVALYENDEFLSNTAIGPAENPDYFQVISILRKQDPVAYDFVMWKLIEGNHHWEDKAYWEEVVPIFYG